ncbi:uncharacterized protein [Centruroides vittatus]|uniref:uncharacterized protein isoform X2 n=1 Tax=Centruroides vittatus TaxID=120091 RepID=UPI00350ECF7F
MFHCNKKENRIIVEPGELVFNVKEGITRKSFAIKNGGTASIAFKVIIKGIIKGKRRVTVQVLLLDARANKEEKFAVLTKIVDEDKLSSSRINLLFQDDNNISYTMNCIINDNNDTFLGRDESHVVEKLDYACKRIRTSMFVQAIILTFTLFILILINSDTKSKEYKGVFFF